MKFVIVESPAKAKTINKYLGKDYIVKSSVGHIRDLPKGNKNAIDIEHGFQPHYVISPEKEKVVRDLASHAKKAEKIILATDPDREGEAIAWHLREVLKEALGRDDIPTERVRFYEITETEVKRAIQEPDHINENLRRAQEARRVLDRLFGYSLSELIWKKVRYGLSAGRVQSPALRILMEREREIRAFTPKPYYILEVQLNDGKDTFTFTVTKELTNLDEALDTITKAEKGSWYIKEIKETKMKRKAKSPFTTSTLQQTASTRLGFSPSRTMRAAQKLYQDGHITYMRTDSTRLSEKALPFITRYIEKTYGKELIEVKQFKTKSKNSQEAHEAIRPTHFDGKMYGSSEDERKLYQLIMQRTIASQMKDANFLKKRVLANIKEGGILDFSINGITLISPGWLLADLHAKGEDVELPPLKEGQELKLIEIENIEKMTTPPNRYSEAGLIKELEKRGIGRPSTYASIIRTLVDRGYVTREGRTLYPTDTGDIVSTFLEKNFSRYISDSFTAHMEDELDEIARGENEYTKVLGEFYTPFKKEVEEKEDIPKLTNLGKAEGYTCPKCGSEMVYKLGRTGKFISCSRYPECNGALTLDGRSMDEEKVLGIDPESKKKVYVKHGPYGAYVQLGEEIKIPERTKFPKGHKKTAEEKELVKRERKEIARLKQIPKPRRASLPKGVSEDDVTLEQALHLLKLPRELGIHPDSGEVIIANVGRFGPYVGHGREFRSIKKSSGLDPYIITYEQALSLLNEPKALPKGVELVKSLGLHPKTKKELRLLKSKSGYFIQKGLKRIYLDPKVNPDAFTLEDALELLKTK